MKAMWKRFRNWADAAACSVGDWISDLTGLVAVPVPLEQAETRREVTLDLPGYLQTNSYCCGALAAAMAVQYLRPRMSLGRVYDAVDPLPEWGAGTVRLLRALRSCGVRVSYRKRHSFAQLCRAVDCGRPVVVLIHNPGSQD